MNKIAITLSLASLIGLSTGVSAQAVDPSPAIATLSGTTALGSSLTVTFANDYTIIGDYFDIWACPNKDVLPIDGVVEGDCVPLTFWNRAQVAGYSQQTTARTMKWELSNTAVPGINPSTDLAYLDSDSSHINVEPPSAEGGWCEYVGWYFIINDYDGGGHSNWSDAMATCPSDTPAASNNLAETGVDAAPAGIAGLALLAVGAIAVTIRRRAVR